MTKSISTKHLTDSPGKQFLLVYGSISVSVLFTGLLITGILVNWHTFTTTSNLFVQVLLLLCVVLFPLAVIALCLFFLIRAILHILTEKEHYKAVQDERRHRNEAHTLQMYLAESRIPADERGNRPAVYERATGAFILPPSGNIIQPVPEHYAPHITYQYKDNSTRSTLEQETAKTLSTVTPPSLDFCITQLEENALQVCLGVSTTTHKPCILNLVDGTHYRIIGSSGYGKSCEAGAILSQSTQTNDPDHLLIALLDLEHKTSRLFEHLPHVAELTVSRKRIPLVATNPEEVAIHFTYLRTELNRRKALSEYDLQRERFLLIYVEEFLSLQREVDPALKAQMLDDFTILALRGRKYGLYWDMARIRSRDSHLHS